MLSFPPMCRLKFVDTSIVRSFYIFPIFMIKKIAEVKNMTVGSSGSIINLP